MPKLEFNVGSGNGADATDGWLPVGTGDGTVEKVQVGTGLSLISGDVSFTVSDTIQLADTSVVAGEYYLPRVVVDGQGRVTDMQSSPYPPVFKINGTSNQIAVNSYSETPEWGSLEILSLSNDLKIPKNISVSSGNLTLPLASNVSVDPPSLGNVRFNDTNNMLESYNGSSWIASADEGSLSLSLVGDVTGSGTLDGDINTTFKENPEFAGSSHMTIPVGTQLEKPTGSDAKIGMIRVNSSIESSPPVLPTVLPTGFVVKKGQDDYVGRSILAGTGIAISDGDGINGNPIVNLGTVPINQLEAFPSDDSKFLNGNGVWSTSGSVTAITAGSGLTGGTITSSGTISLGTVPISNLAGYPSNSTKVLSGDGNWITSNSGVTNVEMVTYVNERLLYLYYVIKDIPQPTKYSATFSNTSVRNSEIWYVMPFGDRISSAHPLDFQENIESVYNSGANFDADYNLTIPDSLQGQSFSITTRLEGNMVKTSEDSRGPAVYFWYNYPSSYRAIQVEIPVGNFDVTLQGTVPSGTSNVTIQVGRDYPLTTCNITTSLIECTITEQ